MKVNFIVIVLALFVFCSCRKMVAAPDPYNPDLPEYSEKGIDTGGLFINTRPWLSKKSGGFSTIRPFEFDCYPSGDSIIIYINGNYKDKQSQYEIPGTIFVVLKNTRISTDEELLQLNGKSFRLDGVTNYGGFSSWSGYEKTGRGTGYINFGKVVRIENIRYGDGRPDNPILYPYIVAGRFEMKFTTTVEYNLTHGRFDAYVLRTRNLNFLF